MRAKQIVFVEMVQTASKVVCANGKPLIEKTFLSRIHINMNNDTSMNPLPHSPPPNHSPCSFCTDTVTEDTSTYKHSYQQLRNAHSVSTDTNTGRNTNTDAMIVSAVS